MARADKQLDWNHMGAVFVFVFVSDSGDKVDTHADSQHV
jgi:hypothetical protein